MNNSLASGLLGLFLGAASAWFAPHPRDLVFPQSPATTVAKPAQTTTGSDAARAGSVFVGEAAWSWRDATPPPPLTASQAGAAIAAWTALAQPNGGPAPANHGALAIALRALLLRLPAASLPQRLEAFDAATFAADSAEHQQLRQLAFQHWTELDAPAAARWAAARTPADLDFARQALVAWSAHDARSAAEWACSLRPESTALALAGPALATLAAHDETGALALAAARGDAFFQKILAELLPALARHDPAAALRAYGPRLWDGGAGAASLRPAIAVWLATDPAATVAWLATLPCRRGWTISSALVGIPLSPAQSTAVADALLTQPGVRQRQANLGAVLTKWFATDADGARAWLARLPDPSLAPLLIERAIHQSPSHMPGNTLPLVLALPEGEKRQERLGRLLQDWTKQDPVAALRWTREHATDPGVAAQSVFVRGIALGAIAADEPATALAEWKHLPDGEPKLIGALTIGQAWARTDPAAARTWLQSLRTLSNDQIDQLLAESAAP